MFQLNPSTKWTFSDDIFRKQSNLEPKFPLFMIFLQKKKSSFTIDD